MRIVHKIKTYLSNSAFLKEPRTALQDKVLNVV